MAARAMSEGALSRCRTRGPPHEAGDVLRGDEDDRMARRVPPGLRGHGRGVDVEGDVEPLEIGAELVDVVPVHEVVGVVVQQVDRRAREHDGDIVFAGDDAHRDAHGLEGPARRARVARDEDEDRLLVGHPRTLSSAR